MSHHTDQCTEVSTETVARQSDPSAAQAAYLVNLRKLLVDGGFEGREAFELCRDAFNRDGTRIEIARVELEGGR